MADPKGLAIVVGGPDGMGGGDGDLPSDMDRNKTDSDVLDSLQQWLDDERAKRELGPMKDKPAGGALPGV